MKSKSVKKKNSSTTSEQDAIAESKLEEFNRKEMNNFEENIKKSTDQLVCKLLVEKMATYTESLSIFSEEHMMVPLKAVIDQLFHELFHNNLFEAEKEIQPYFEGEFKIEMSKQIDKFIANKVEEKFNLKINDEE